jgi:branched-chain amino acid transport system substrate-binding protein
MKRVQAAAWRNVCGRVWISSLVALLACVLGSVAPLQAQEPIKIGFGVSLTGGLASSGKAHLLSKQIWAEEINAKGGLLGRPVRLIISTTRPMPPMFQASIPSSWTSTRSTC